MAADGRAGAFEGSADVGTVRVVVERQYGQAGEELLHPLRQHHRALDVSNRPLLSFEVTDGRTVSELGAVGQV
jgi:hypothetical protein